MRKLDYCEYYIVLCLVLIAFGGFATIGFTQTQCVNKFDTVAEIEQCMRLIN